MDFANASCTEFVTVLASNAPVPGGGGASALVAAIGTALGNMVGSLTVSKKKYADVQELAIESQKKGNELKAQFVDVIDRDTEAFNAVSAVFAMPKDTDEEKAAALEEEKAAVKEQAEALQARLEAGEDPEALAEEFSDSLYSSEVALEQMGSTVNSEYSEWAYDSARRPGDITLVEYAGGSSESYNYCVALFHDRVRDDAPTADVRHILIGAADANITPTEEQYEQAKAKAEELLAQWEAGDATEDSFAQLAQENSADTSSASNGGLLQYVSPYSGYVDTFTQWSLDPSRQPGDTGIIQNTGSSVKGYHIMYFAGWDDPVWTVSAKNALNNEQYSQWAEKLASACTVTRGSGLKYVE